MRYEEKLNQIDCLENTWQTAVNQTEIYRLIQRHFAAPLPAGKRRKKAVVIGYDGCTAEMLRFLGSADSSAIRYLLQNGGHGVFSYAGGAAYPLPITQETSTAPGWCSMLTGTLADVNGVNDNGITKEVEPKSLLLSLVEEGAARSSAFYVSWEGHFEEYGATYLKEKAYCAARGLPVTFVCAGGDDGTKENVLGDIAAADGSDFIFSIFEYPDHFGHGFDFRSEVPEYREAFRLSEETGRDIISAIQNRAAYGEEDWLILITSDHGGYNTGHGFLTIQERMTFIVAR